MVDGNPAYDFDLAVERVRAGVAAARALPHPFVFCARADGVMNGSYGIEEAIRRIRAFEEAGADLLYVPVPPGVDELKQVLAAVSKPVNALAAGPLSKCSVGELAAMGVRRISLGSMIARATHAVIRDATKAMLEEGSFAPLSGVAGGNEINSLLAAGSSGEARN